MIDQAFIDKVALSLVRKFLSLKGEVRGVHYDADPEFDYEGHLARSEPWQSMAKAAIGVMEEERVDGLAGVELMECSSCHAAYQLNRVQRTSFHCPNCKNPDGLLRKAGVSKS